MVALRVCAAVELKLKRFVPVIERALPFSLIVALCDGDGATACRPGLIRRENDRGRGIKVRTSRWHQRDTRGTNRQRIPALIERLPLLWHRINARDRHIRTEKYALVAPIVLVISRMSPAPGGPPAT